MDVGSAVVTLRGDDVDAAWQGRDDPAHHPDTVAPSDDDRLPRPVRFGKVGVIGTTP